MAENGWKAVEKAARAFAKGTKRRLREPIEALDGLDTDTEVWLMEPHPWLFEYEVSAHRVA